MNELNKDAEVAAFTETPASLSSVRVGESEGPGGPHFM